MEKMMMMIEHLQRLMLIVAAFTLVTQVAKAESTDKSDKTKPRWLHSSVQPSNTSFVYDVVTSDAKSLPEAREQALSSLLTHAGLEGGQTVKTDVWSDDSEQHVYHNGQADKTSNMTIRVQTTMMGQPATLTAKKIDEYWERGIDGAYHLTTLYARSQVDGTPQFDNVKLTTNYGAKGLWRSAIIPGWGQLYKGSTTKGGLIMGGTAVCIGAIVYTDCMRSSYSSKIDKTHSAEQKRNYANQRSNYSTARDVCIGALCALYAYNVIDAIVSPGARRILTSPSHIRGLSYKWSPVLTDDYGVGVSATLTF